MLANLRLCTPLNNFVTLQYTWKICREIPWQLSGIHLFWRARFNYSRYSELLLLLLLLAVIVEGVCRSCESSSNTSITEQLSVWGTSSWDQKLHFPADAFETRLALQEISWPNTSTRFWSSIILVQILIFFAMTPFEIPCSYHPSEVPLNITSKIRNKKCTFKNKISQLAIPPLHSPHMTCVTTTKSSLLGSNISEPRQLMSW